MAQDKKDGKLIIQGDKAREKLLEGAHEAYKTVSSTYGPKGRNVLIGKPFGRPTLTRDGVTVARDTYFSDEPKNMGAQHVLEAAETTNRVAGDGTTATVALSYHLLKQGAAAITEGMHPMEVKRQILDDSYTILDKLETLSKPTKKTQLKEVATVSSGDSVLGEMIAEAIEKVGNDGGIIAEKAAVSEVECTYVEGYYLQSGFTALERGKKEIVDPVVVVAERRISSAADALEILNGIARVGKLQPGQVPRVVFIGNIEDAAYNMIVDNINRAAIDAIVIKTPPQYGGEMGRQLLEDIAAYANCLVLNNSVNIKSFVKIATDNKTLFSPYIGSVDRVVANKTDSTIFASGESEAVQQRVLGIKDQIEHEEVPAIIEKLKDRVAKLEGKIALFRIGGATETTKEETEFRVEDAIQATRAAASYGVVPGGGTTLLELSKCDVGGIMRNALRDTFNQLLINAGLPESLQKSILESPVGHGVNLRSNDTKIVSMVDEGILDPKLVTEQTIRNASTVAADMLTTDTLIYPETKEDK